MELAVQGSEEILRALQVPLRQWLSFWMAAVACLEQQKSNRPLQQ